MSVEPVWRAFVDAEVAADALCDTITGLLRDGVAARGHGSLVVSGGRSPVPLFTRLASVELDWRRVTVTLADERWVPLDHPASNQALVARHLLRDRAAPARFVGLYTGDPSARAGEAACAERLAGIPRPFDAVVLGMGADGHTASLFPGAENLGDALGGEAACRAIHADAVPKERMTLTLATLLDARRIFLAISGSTKREVYRRALEDGAVETLPIRAVLRAADPPVEVYWSP